MAFFVYDPSGKPVGLLAPGEDPSRLRASGYTVSEVSDADVTTDANGQVLVSIAALQQQQAFANSLQAAAALRQVEQNQINAYGAQTSRLGQIIPLVGQTQNYGLLSNITAGDARAPYLSVPASLSRMAGPSPIQADYSQAKTYSAKDASDFARKATEEKTSAENQASGGRKPLTGTTQAPKATPAAQAATGGGAGDAYAAARHGPNTATTPGTYISAPYDPGAPPTSVRHGPNTANTPGTYISAPYSATPAAQAAAGSAATAASSAPASSASPTASPAAQAFNPRTSPLSMFPATYGRTPTLAPEQMGSVAGMGRSDTNDKTPMWKKKYHEAVAQATGGGHGSEARERANAAAGMSEAQAAHEIKHGRNPYSGIHAAGGGTFGGTDMARPSMFGGPAMPSPADPTSGFGFDPHAPTQTPDNLRQIAAILASPPSPSPSALEAAVRECWSLDPQSGQPLYTGHFADNAAKGTQAVPNGGLLGDQETQGDVSAEGGAEPPPPQDMPAPVGKPAMFAEGGTSGVDRRAGPNANYDPRWGFLPKQPTGAVANPSSAAPTASYSGLPPAPRPPAAAAPVAASGGVGGTPARSRAPAARGGGPRAERPSAPSADIMRKVTNYYVAQFGGTADDATNDLRSGSADATNWLRSALGMAMAGQLDQYSAAPTTTAAAPAPAAAAPASAAAEADKKVAAAAPNDYAGAVMGGVGNGLRLGGGRVTTAATAAPQTTTPTTPPHPDEVKAAIAGMTYDDAVRYINSLYGRAASAVAAAPRAGGGTDFVYRDDPYGPDMTDPLGDWNMEGPSTFEGGPWVDDPAAGGGSTVPPSEGTISRPIVPPLGGMALNPNIRNAAGGTTFVARRPTMFSAGGQQFLVGEDTRHGYPSGADELVSIGGGPGRAVVHVDPLQRRGTGIPPAVAATANLAVPGSPYRPKVGIPASAFGPGRADAYAYAAGGTAAMPMDPSMGGGDPSMGGDHAAGLPDVIPVGNGIVLVRQPDGSYLPMDAQQMEAMLGGPPAGGGDPSMGNQMPMGAGPSPMAAGGTRVYGTVAPGATISRVGGQPSATGQIKVPGGRGGSTTQPFYAVQPFPNPEYALSRNVDQLTPDELQQVGLVTQNRAGYGVNQWAALQAKGRLMSQAPAALGVFNRAF